MNPFLKRAEADPLIVELEALAQDRQRHDVLEDARQLSGLIERGSPQGVIGIVSGHRRILADELAAHKRQEGGRLYDESCGQ